MSACSLFARRPIVEYETAEELVQANLATTEGYEEGDPYVYREIDGYVYILCGGVTNKAGKYYESEGGYGGLMIPEAFNIIFMEEFMWQGKIDAIDILKDYNGGNYLITISGRRFIDRKSVEDPNFPLKIYDSEGNELEKLYDYKQLSCTWIAVLHELPEDYAIYADYKGETYLLCDAQTIMGKGEEE